MVMNQLNKKLFNDIKKTKGQFISILIISMFGTMLLTGMSVVHSSLKNTVDQYYEESNLADLTISYTDMDDKGIQEISDIKGIEEIGWRKKIEGFNLQNDSTVLIHTVNKEDPINKIKMASGNYPIEKMSCIIGEAYAKSNDIKNGDTLTIKINGEDYNLKVSGNFNTAEYTYLVQNATESMIPDNNKYGLLYISEETYEEMTFATQSDLNEVLIKLRDDISDDEEIDNIIEEIKEKTNKYGYIFESKKTDQPSYMKIDSEIQTTGSMSKVFPYVFFLVCAAIIFITMQRNVRNERGQIGIMKALGISRTNIAIHYIGYAVSSSVIGAILGNILGIILLPKVQFSSYDTLYTLPEIELDNCLGYMFISVVVLLIFSITASLLAVFDTLKEKPAQCLRPVVLEKRKQILLEKWDFLWRNLSHRTKLILRNIFFNKTRCFLSSLGVIGCVGLLFCGFGLLDVTGEFIQNHFEIIQKYDILLTLETPTTWESDIDILDKDIDKIDKQSVMPVSFKIKDNSYNNTMYVVERDNSSVELYDINKKTISYPKDGVILPYKIARDTGVEIGDKITLKIESDYYENKEIEVNIAAISELYISQDIYVSYDYLESLSIDPLVTGYYLTYMENANSDRLIDSLKNKDEYRGVSVKSEQREQFDTLYGSTKQTVFVLILLSASLVFSAIFNISSINIFERTRDLATLKVLGYYNKEVYSLVDNENLLITILGSIFGIIFGIWIFKQVLLASETDSMYYAFEIKTSIIFISITITLLFTLITNLILRRKINRIDMVSSLKGVE